MSKYEQLRLIIKKRLNELERLNTSSAVNFAKKSELNFILSVMSKLDNDEVMIEKESKLQQEINAVNESLSEAAESEWNKESTNFLYTGIPSFDKIAFEKIIAEKGIKAKVA